MNAVSAMVGIATLIVAAIVAQVMIDEWRAR